MFEAKLPSLITLSFIQLLQDQSQIVSNISHLAIQMINYLKEIREAFEGFITERIKISSELLIISFELLIIKEKLLNSYLSPWWGFYFSFILFSWLQAEFVGLFWLLPFTVMNSILKVWQIRIMFQIFLMLEIGIWIEMESFLRSIETSLRIVATLWLAQTKLITWRVI